MRHFELVALWLCFFWTAPGVPLLLCSHNANNSNGRIIRTDSGVVKGVTTITGTGKNVVKYLGIPYGKPTTGSLRFALPQEVDPWKGTLLADKLALACYQWKDGTFGNFSGSQMWNANTDMSEDCLNLNIWTPADAKDLPVLVWIYGGGFMYGSPSLDLYNGDMLAGEGQVVVININYRVGPFGFLYLGDDLDLAPGNMGLADQQLALRWIKRNVRSFGGDPNRVTIFGESAGAASVSSHLLSEGSWDLFRYAILQSGTILEPWAARSPEENLRRARLLAESLNCWRREMSATVTCLRTLPTDQIQAAADKLFFGFLDFPFVMTSYDAHFFKGTIQDRLKTSKIKKTSILMGSNTDEGSFWLPYYLTDYFNNVNDGIIDRKEYMTSISIAFSNLTKLAQKSLAYHYEFSNGLATNNNNNNNGMVQQPKTIFRDLLSKQVGDYYFTCKVLSTADLLTSLESVVYLYYFTERSSVNPWPKWMGVMHGYEIEYIFGAPLRRGLNYAAPEVKFSRQVIRAWVEFAKTGKPPLANNAGQWPIYGQQKPYVTMNSQSETIGHRFNEDDCNFWNEISQICDHVRAQSISTGQTNFKHFYYISSSTFLLLLILLIR